MPSPSDSGRLVCAYVGGAAHQPPRHQLRRIASPWRAPRRPAFNFRNHSRPHVFRIGLRHRPASQNRINADRLSHPSPSENLLVSIGTEHALVRSRRPLALAQTDDVLCFHVDLSVPRITRHFFPGPTGEVEFLIRVLQLNLRKHYAI